MYKIKEIYYTLQGEGHHTGKPAIFCRFSGCNLWSGREEDRSNAICQFCDTDFWGMDGSLGGKYNGEELVKLCNSLWPSNSNEKFIVFTGGEPLLQLDNELLEIFKFHNYFTAVETNGTITAPTLLDWVCMSPKANSDIVINNADEIKIVYPQSGISPEQFVNENFDHFYIQPMDNENQQQNIGDAIEYCKANPKWSLSLQTHKIIGID